MIYVFTSAAVNYLPKVRLLCHSLKKFHPEFSIVLGLADTVPAWLNVSDEPFDEVIAIDDLPIENKESWIFRHSIVELSTAIKPMFLEKLLARDDCDAVLYFDPDMVLFSRLDDLLSEMREANIGLTPHQVAPDTELSAIIRNEIESLKHGIYNLGFIAVRNSAESKRFAEWWSHRLYHFCRAAVEEGLFTDQRWIDFVPVYFDGVKILKSPRYNVAPWNLTKRKVTGNGKIGYQVEGVPLGFYHFTGFDSGQHKIVANIHAPGNNSVQELIEWYEKETTALTDALAEKTNWAYRDFSNGERIEAPYRLIYRNSPDLHKIFPRPFQVPLHQYSFFSWLKNTGTNEYPDLLNPYADKLRPDEQTLIPQEPVPAHENNLTFILESQLPSSVAVGNGNSIYVAGACFHARQRIYRLEVLVDDLATAANLSSIDRQDIAQIYNKNGLGNQLARESGFWAVAQIPVVEKTTQAIIKLRATFANGNQLTYEIGQLQLMPDVSQLEVTSVSPPKQNGQQPLVTICMATYNPSLALFVRQIASIRQQTYENWICIISDDASEPKIVQGMKEIIVSDTRFIFCNFPDRKGFYHNFERALSMAPKDAEYIALSDQDDHWYPEKISKLLACFEADTHLVYSDMRIVTETGEVVSDTYWTTRANNYNDFSSLAIANTVSGAASMFRRELLREVLPFPVTLGRIYHDHWIAMMAATLGKIGYVDEALYDYLQHSSNVIGHVVAIRPTLPKVLLGMYGNMKSSTGRMIAREIYEKDVLRIRTMAEVAQRRGGEKIDAEKKQTLARLARLDQSIWGLLWLLMRGIKDYKGKTITLNMEFHLALGVWWKHFIWMKTQLKRIPMIRWLL